MEAKVLNIQGQDTGRTVELKDSIFNIKPNDHAIYLDVKAYLANQRQGTHKTKERGEVAGSRRKLRRQKGTGYARVGDIKNPLFRGGGRIFGPRPRSYHLKINKKVKLLARKSALTYKAKDNAITVIEDFQFEQPKTKKFLELKKNLKLADKKLLLVFKNQNKNVYLSARNLKDAEVVTVNQLNTYNILKYKHLVLSESAAKFINELLDK